MIEFGGLMRGRTENQYGTQSYAVISPKIAYKFNNRLKAGFVADIALDKRKDNIIGANNHYGVFAEYTLWSHKDFSIFVDGIISHIYQKKRYVYPDGGIGVGIPQENLPPLPEPRSATEVGFTPGISYTIPKVRLDVKLRYGFIGYNDMRTPWSKYYNVRDIDGCLTRGDFMLDGSSRRLQLSIGYTFGW